MPTVYSSPMGPKPQFELTDGTPAVGYKLFTYVGGSVNTKQTTYTDYTGGSANTNPIVLNTLGQPSTEIWLAAGVSYKFVLAPPTDTDPPSSPIWTIDGLRGINDASVSVDQWIAGPVATYSLPNQFTLAGDQTSTFHVGRRVKAISLGPLYGTITNSAYVTSTTVTVAWDSGALDPSVTNPSIWYGLISYTNSSIGSMGMQTNPVTTKGDLIVRNATTLARLGVGADGTVLIADSAASTGVSWGATASFSNRLINGQFQIDQRVNSATARSDDTYCLDRWYVLTQTASVQVTQQTDQEDGTPFNIRLTQNQAAAQRMGLAQIIESKNCKDLRAKVVAMAARVRISNSQAVRYAILEWTGTADSVTSDVVNDWTSSTYTAGNFFLAANLTVTAVGSITPNAATWTDLTTLSATLGSSGNNLIIFIWTEGTAAQNVTLDIGRARFGAGASAPTIPLPSYSDELLRCNRYYWKSFAMATAPAQNAGTTGAISAQSRNGTGAGGVGAFVVFPCRMFASPTITTYNPSAANANWRAGAVDDAVVTVDQTNDWSVALESSTAVSLAQQCRIHVTAEAEL